QVDGCKAVGNHAALGGGVAAGVLTLRRATIANNNATVLGATASEYAAGGGAWAESCDISASSIIGNEAVGNLYSRGGGVAVTASGAKLAFSTIAGNHADGKGGGLYASSFEGSVTIGNSTISGNDANLVGAVYLLASPATISNTTIAFNSAQY